ncbi:MAG: 6-phosphofructokinase [Bacteroidales bacterium]|jgi:6-phosphofructokinase|nr:6-phosphofructokinase [Bacteroidales bacterium]
MKKIKRIGVLTSGGDAPGMNAAIRAVTRTAILNDISVVGIMAGYQGLLNGEFNSLTAQNVRGIIQTGGTILRSARCPEFKTVEGRRKGMENLKKEQIDALVVIGGDGTFRGANELSGEYDIPIVGIPGTIDNDIYGTEYTVGYDTCLNTIVNAVDKIRDTASSHNRIFFVEVMGNESGFIAMNSGLACGADVILIPEQKNQLEKTRLFLSERARQNKSSVIMVAEGIKEGTMVIAEKMKGEFPQFDIRVTVLGYIQRGGSPSARDRILASELGVESVNALIAGKKSMMIGRLHGQIRYEPFITAIKLHKYPDAEFLRVAESIGTYTPTDEE